jgi:anti-sigma factor RsiW
MTDVGRLVQRFLDQELSAEERVQFVVRLGRDDALRRRVIALEQLTLDASRLPRPIVPDRFVERVMERTASVRQSRSPWRGIAEMLWAPRELRWNLAGAATVACAVVLAVGGIVYMIAPRSVQAPARTDAQASAGATEPSTVLVRLVVAHTGAKTVHVAGDFNAWNPERTPLEQVSDDAWAVTLALQPGRYEYMFVVDGRQWIVDPFATEQNDDGFGSRNAVLEVRPRLGAQS